MAANQYNYPPPPPPPPPQVGPPVGYPQYHQSLYSQQASRGGGRGRGRGNHSQGGRGDFHGSAPYNHHAGGYNGPAQVGGGYVQQNPAPYIGPQPPGPPPNGYPPPQWQGQHHASPHPQQHQPQVHQAPAPVPLSTQNYHPNYAPQVYQQPQSQQPQQYGPQQPFHQSPPQNSYVHPSHSQASHPSGPPPQQWQGPPHQAQTPYNGGGRGRGRGNGSTRGGFEAPLMGPPIRMGFGNDRQVEPMPQASNGYPPYANPQSSPSVPYAQPAYQGYSQNFPQKTVQRQSLELNPFYSSGSYRGRGGMNNRGKRDASTMDKRFRPGKSRQFSGPSPHILAPDLPQKPAVDDGAKFGDGKKKKKKKRKTNTLGLTPRNEEYEDSEEEDDLDEEIRLAAVIAHADNPMGPSDLAAWLAERRLKWPTKARREAREAEFAKRRAQAAEQSARDKAKARKDREGKEVFEAAQIKTESTIGEGEIERQQRKAEKLRKKLEKAEKKVQDAIQAGTKRKRGLGDDGEEEDEVVNSNGEFVNVDLVDQVIAKATAVTDDASDSTASSSSEDGSSSDSDDSGPETQTSRRTAATQVLPPKKEILSRQCKYFSTGGVCGKKGKCRFVHDQSVRDAALREKELNGGRMTLAQRLVQNDKEKDDLMVLKSIQYLYKRGVLNSPPGASAYYNDQNFDERYQQHYDDRMQNLMQDFESYREIKSEVMDSEV